MLSNSDLSNFVVVKLLYNKNDMSVSLQRFWRNVIFSAAIYDRGLLVKIPFIKEHQFFEYFIRVSVGRATKGLYVYLMKRKFVVCYLR